MARLILFGPPGAGKGTQAAALSRQLKVPHISTGDIFRSAIAARSDLGLKVQNYLDEGKLVPDVVVIDMVRDRLSQPDIAEGWILDGFPRTVPQAQALDQLLSEINQDYSRVLNLQVSEALLIERLLGRQRKDDTEDVIQERLRVYRNDTAPVLAFYEQGTRLVNIDGAADVEIVTSRIQSAVSGVE
ncbi:Adenylate kinase [Acaryochloris thomasi RCC1774]|uniref:Adenylate kinase n=1 Tax=Acaryochloris thomasi RCC1774 TaxID=1764569 RepID=A0A2W1K6J2_9CYAN|nr:adenylate kinase [Acaryochloris thomasi]PZD75341.1 Adenylate kinase [Acaryochloris thomasi RCC1774]